MTAHLLAAERLSILGFGRYIISATSPFVPEQAERLAHEAKAVVGELFPHYQEFYQRRGWRMHERLDRVYDNSRARQALGWAPLYDFGSQLQRLSAGQSLSSDLAQEVGPRPRRLLRRRRIQPGQRKLHRPHSNRPHPPRGHPDPPWPGSFAPRRDQPEFINYTFRFTEMARKMAAGLLASGHPAYYNLDFLSGERGAHVNIAGMSGVATKTSYALFLLYSLFHSDQTKKSRAILFNGKGDDLLYLDKPNHPSPKRTQGPPAPPPTNTPPPPAPSPPASVGEKPASC